jgi:hypothetical protein
MCSYTKQGLLIAVFIETPGHARNDEMFLNTGFTSATHHHTRYANANLQYTGYASATLR